MIKRKQKRKPRHNPEHKQVKIIVQGKHEISVDEGIAPLIKLLDKFKISTVLSCEENKPGIMWIAFERTKDLENFLNLVADYADEEFYGRIMGHYNYSNHWTYDIFLVNYGVKELFIDDNTVKEKYLGRNDFLIRPSVRFPRKDLFKILKVLKSKL